jgi:AcrR family transcriptional regulator
MPKVVDHDAQREMLLARFFELVQRHGTTRLSMREIARGTGVSTGALYHYFADRNEIVSQLYAWILRQDFIDVDARSTDPRDRVRRVMTALRRAIPRHQAIFPLTLDLALRGPREDAREILTGYAKHYERALQRALGVGHPEARGIYIFLAGLLVLSLVGPSTYRVAHHLVRLERALPQLLEALRGARPAPPRRRSPRQPPRRATKPRSRRTASTNSEET